MRHHIIVKWNGTPRDPVETAREIEKLFAGVMDIPGVHGFSVQPSVTDRPNRYDLMIVVLMDDASLPLFDQSAVHLRWKEQYGPLIAQKAIFDCA